MQQQTDNNMSLEDKIAPDFSKKNDNLAKRYVKWTKNYNFLLPLFEGENVKYFRACC